MTSSERLAVSANRPWATPVGYSRAVRVGDTIEVAGTTATSESGEVLFPGDAYEQTRECLRIIGEALSALGSSFKDVTRTRVFVTDISSWRDAARAHNEIFEDIRPASTFVEISRLLDDDLVVEIEAVAVVVE